MEMQKLKDRLKEIDQELKRNRFGLERYEAQCKRWQKELDDLDTGGFFSFLVNTESKKHETLQELSDCKRDLEAAVSSISSLEAEEIVVREKLESATPPADSTAPDDSADIDMLDEDMEDKAFALIAKINKVIEVTNQSISEGFEQLASARRNAMSQGRPGKRGMRLSSSLPSSNASGANIQMALDCLTEPVENLCQLLNPVVANLKESNDSKSLESSEELRKKLFDLSTIATVLKTPEDYSSARMSPQIDLGDDAKITQISNSLLKISAILTLIEGFIENGNFPKE